MKLAIAIFILCNFGIEVHSNCGKRLVKHEALIVGGTESKEGFWPWHASILHVSFDWDLNYKCGGTLLNSNAVLTAAHCVYENGQPMVPNRVLIQLGRNDLVISGPNSKEFKAFQIIPHPHFNISSLKHDIALILLATQVTHNNYIQPICLWNANKIDLSNVVGEPGTVVGFGFTKNDRISNTLQEVVMPVVSLGTCLGSNNEFYNQFLSDHTFCAGSRNGATACNGDSGGSMVFEDEGVYRIRGIVSVTQARSGEHRALCKVDEYVVFTDVAKYLPWIAENVPALPLPTVPTKKVTLYPRVPEIPYIPQTLETISWNGNWALDCEFIGNDLKSVTSMGEECGGICAGNPQCTHFTWKYGTCWMKQNGALKTDAVVSTNKGAVCGIVVTGGVSWNGNWALSCEFKGNDLKNVESSGEECGGICANNPQCTHFTWSYGTCWLKKYNGVSRDDAVRVRDTSFTCGVIRNRV